MLKQISFLGLLRRNENITQWYNFGLEEKCYSPYVWSPYLIQIRRWSFGARHYILINISRTRFQLFTLCEYGEQYHLWIKKYVLNKHSSLLALWFQNF